MYPVQGSQRPKFSKQWIDLIVSLTQRITDLENKSLSGSYVYESLQSLPENPAHYSGAYILLDYNEYTGAEFYVPLIGLDDTYDITIYFILEVNYTYGVYAIKYYQGSVKTDNTELFSWGIANNVTTTKNTISGNVFLYGIVYNVVHYNKGDMLKVLMRNSQSGKQLKMYGVFVRYTHV